MIDARDLLCRVGSCVALFMAVTGIAGCGSTPVTAPTEFADYNSPGATFACEYPKDWQSDGGGKRGLEWAKFKSGPAEIRIDTGVAGSLMGDIGGSFAGSDAEQLGPEFEPVHGVHESGKDAAEQQFSGYKEVGEIEVIEVSLGPARRSEFTAASTFGSGLRGYRATALGKDKAVYAYCVCPESDWKTLQPAFEKVLLSLRRGQSE
ncbi:MAG: hypothetical protein WD738_16540 [Pirellulales bacterium]